ncbi:MAG TPA: GNAT family N-acetyltransferase [Acidimicrobiia bacterium]|nr:GNAT family N-acetyltransferase [Acidimicrobiia bacterium]
MSIPLHRALPAESDQLADVLTRAFLDDPVIVWFFPDSDERPRRVRRFFREIVLHGGLSQDAQICTTEDQGAVAVWAPPNRWRLTLRRQLRLLPRYLSIVSPRYATSRLVAFNKVELRHPKQPPHWYLATLGTDPDRQGHGLGSALLGDRLARCDAEGLPAYLESSKESNVPFYERHGFSVTERFDLPDGPSLWLMWRDPR